MAAVSRLILHDAEAGKTRMRTIRESENLPAKYIALLPWTRGSDVYLRKNRESPDQFHIGPGIFLSYGKWMPWKNQASGSRTRSDGNKRHPRGLNSASWAYVSIFIFERDTVIGPDGNFSRYPYPPGC